MLVQEKGMEIDNIIVLLQGLSRFSPFTCKGCFLVISKE